MQHHRRRAIELGLLATLGLGDATRPAAADPARGAPPSQVVRPAEPELDYIYFHDAHHTTMSGDLKDIERARRWKRPGEPLLWFRDAGREYVVRDLATLNQVEAVSREASELGEAQGKLGAQMGVLGSQQGDAGARHGLLGARIGTLAVRQATLELRASNAALPAAERAALDRQRRELHKQQRALERKLESAATPRPDVTAKLEALGREMETLGKQQEVASRKARTELRGLARKAIANGTATPAR
jgi:hypothetical protein